MHAGCSFRSYDVDRSGGISLCELQNAVKDYINGGCREQGYSDGHHAGALFKDNLRKVAGAVADSQTCQGAGLHFDDAEASLHRMQHLAVAQPTKHSAAPHTTAVKQRSLENGYDDDQSQPAVRGRSAARGQQAAYSPQMPVVRGRSAARGRQAAYTRQHANDPSQESSLSDNAAHELEAIRIQLQNASLDELYAMRSGQVAARGARGRVIQAQWPQNNRLAQNR